MLGSSREGLGFFKLRFTRGLVWLLTRVMKKILLISLLAAVVTSVAAADFTAGFPANLSRNWPGPELWANPLPDWSVTNGALVCNFPGGNRNVAVLTRELSARPGRFIIRVTLDQLSPTLAPGSGWTGFQVGVQGQFKDYRDSAVFGRGLCAGIGFDGRLFIAAGDKTVPAIEVPLKNVTLELVGEPSGDTCRLTLRAFDGAGKELSRTVRDRVHPSWLTGLVNVTVSTDGITDSDVTVARPDFKQVRAMKTQRGGKAQMSFRNLALSGPKFDAHPDRAFGPVLWCQHTLQNNGTLKLLAQFPPMGQGTFTAELELDGKPAGSAGIESPSCTALFRVQALDTGRNHPYAVIYRDEMGAVIRFTGTVRAISAGGPLTVAAFSCNDGTGFPHGDLIANVAAQKPDLLAFLGDQIYEGNGGYGVLYNAGERSISDYLRKLFLHGWVWRDLMRDLPTFAIPDDHDVFHGNLWGNGGKKADLTTGYGSEAQDSGGYKMPPGFVNVVHRTQAGSLPDAFDPAPCDQGISAYYTSWEYGPLDMAILGDRQWKSAPKPLLPEADIFNGFVRNENWNPRTQAAHPDAQLLGPRQEEFLKHWATHRPAEARFRIVLSQTPWNCMATLPQGKERSDSVVPSLPIMKPGEYPTNDVTTIDFDASGWPQEKRDLALRLMKQAGCILHVAGDQHLGSTGRYGIETWNDGPYWIATPAIANLWPRRWFPMEPGGNHVPGAPRYTGEYEDQFGNKITVLAAANPQHVEEDRPIQIGDRSPGYSIIRFDHATREVKLENWPYWASPAKPAPQNQPYPGWPITVK